MSHLNAWTSPRLGIRFVLTDDGMSIYDPRGEPFLSAVEQAVRLREAQARAEEADRRVAEAAARAAKEQVRAERLGERLRALGHES